MDSNDSEQITEEIYMDDETKEKINNNNNSRKKVGQTMNSNPKKKEKKLVINTYYSQYEVLEEAGKVNYFRTSYDEDEDWDIWWIDSMILPNLLHKLRPYQRTNHLPNV